MKAVYYEEHGDTDVVEYGDQPDPEVGRDECLVEVKAGGLNHLDVWTRRGMPSPGAFPHIPGSDAAGVVSEVGEDVSRFEAGDRVAVEPGTSCGECEFCRDGDYSLCESYALIGEHMGGVHSELAAVPEDNLVHVPEHVDFVTAASAPLVFQTAWRMLVTRAEVDQSDTVLVLGASGGVGHAALQVAVNAGAEVWATASSEEKLDYAAELGADHLIDYESEDFADVIYEDTDGRGVDVVVDHVGEATWDSSIKAAAKGGRIVTCGATSGPMPETNLSRVFWKQLNILGSTMGTPGEMDDVLAKVWDGTFESRIRAVLPMSETARAHEMLQDREGFGSVVVVPDSVYEEGDVRRVRRVSDDDSTYHFDPDEFREGESPGTADGVEAGEERSATGRAGESAVTPPSGSDGPYGVEDREFDWRGWVLVGMLFVALAVVPTLLYFVPRAQGLTASIGLGYRDAFLVLPLVPAVVLALLAVWATTRP